MSLTGNGSLSIRRKDVKEQKSIALGLKKLVMAHKATLGDTGINLASLSAPTEMSSLGFVNPNSTEILSANLKFYRNNLRIVSSHKGLLMDYLSYDVTSSSRISFTGFTAEDGEIFVITYDDNAKTGVTMVDTAPVVSTGTLAVGVTDYNVGIPFSVGDHASVAQLGSVVVFRNGAIQFRNPNNGISGGNYQEVAAGGGLGVIIRFNSAPVGIADNIVVFSLGTAWRPDGSVLAEVENLAGQLDRVIPTVAALAGVPETDFQGAPNNVDLKAFGDIVLALKSAVVPITSAWTTFTPIFTNGPAGFTNFSPWEWRRINDNLEIRGAFTSTGAGGGGVFGLNIPAALAGTVNLESTYSAGIATTYIVASDPGFSTCGINSTGGLSGVFNLLDNGTGSSVTGAGLPNGAIVAFNISVRVLNWSATQTLAEQLGI